MSYLLDTRALLWWLVDDARLGHSARATIRDPKSLVYMSSASAWEIATKHRLGKLTWMNENGTLKRKVALRSPRKGSWTARVS